MNFMSALDELQHWLGLLTVDVALGVNQRHLHSTARLCFLLIERIEREREPKVDVETFRRLELQLLDLQRAISRQACSIRWNSCRNCRFCVRSSRALCRSSTRSVVRRSRSAGRSSTPDMPTSKSPRKPTRPSRG